jgi:hypothetical protein
MPGVFPNPEHRETVRVERERTSWIRIHGAFSDLDETGVAPACRAYQIRDRRGQLRTNAWVGRVFQ